MFFCFVRGERTERADSGDAGVRIVATLCRLLALVLAISKGDLRKSVIEFLRPFPPLLVAAEAVLLLLSDDFLELLELSGASLSLKNCWMVSPTLGRLFLTL